MDNFGFFLDEGIYTRTRTWPTLLSPSILVHISHFYE